ncbi:MAG: hypothetical protein GY923_15405 [Aestuariibacter sp.]|nr:hypothetical protein [Aestuariibacter sp.]
MKQILLSDDCMLILSKNLSQNMDSMQFVTMAVLTTLAQIVEEKRRTGKLPGPEAARQLGAIRIDLSKLMKEVKR